MLNEIKFYPLNVFIYEVERYFYTCNDLTFSQAFDFVDSHTNLIIELWENGKSITDTIKQIIFINNN